jgi:uncharacterized MAPEG superfamily protein
MEWVAIVAALALAELVWFGVLTGQARSKYGVEAPAVTGHPIFERYFRVQQNTLEQIVPFLPALFLFGRYVSAPIAAALGAIWLVGRVVYLRAYVADPARRGLGFGLTAIPTLVLIVGALIGAIVAL